MFLANKDIGDRGEIIAINFLLSQGFKILEKKYRTPLGEIDIIANKNEKLFFIEVKTRVGTKKGFPYEALNHKKLKHICNASQFYLLNKKNKIAKLSIGLISIILKPDYQIEKLDFYENILL
ncbi:MAG: YraN family protein [Microgenomates group bacterium]|nr:YraN family protein [Microgenomates group bacterium]